MTPGSLGDHQRDVRLVERKGEIHQLPDPGLVLAFGEVGEKPFGERVLPSLVKENGGLEDGGRDEGRGAPVGIDRGARQRGVHGQAGAFGREKTVEGGLVLGAEGIGLRRAFRIAQRLFRPALPVARPAHADGRGDGDTEALEMAQRCLGIVQAGERNETREPFEFGVVGPFGQAVARRDPIGVARATLPHGPARERPAPVSPGARPTQRVRIA